MASKNEITRESDLAHYLQTFKRYPITLDYGKGARVWDLDGKEYVDGLAGIAVNALGHAHPKLVKAISEQAAKLIHISNLYLSEPQMKLSEKLVEISKMERVFMCNSGAEAVEGAFKIARKYGSKNGKGGEIISFEGSFHGRTLATIASGKKIMQDGFGPMPKGFHQAKLNDIESVKDLVNNQTAAIIVEPIQGEGGINEASTEFLKALRQLCNDRKIVLIFDEIQCGIGRTGKWFAKDLHGVQPDIMTLAKGLAGGVPAGAIMIRQTVADAIDFGDHGTTFGGNPLACAAALAVLNTIEEDGLMKAAVDQGDYFRELVKSKDLGGLVRIKGKGLMIGLEFEFETKELVNEMLKNGVLANATAGNVLRLVPPLVVTKEDMKAILNGMMKSLKSI